MKLKNLEVIVLEQLEKKPITRENDFILYGCVLRKLGVSKDAKLFDFLVNAKENQMPCFESVSRCRRHIQQVRLDLQDAKTVEARREKIGEYKEYNLSGVGE